MNNEVKQFGRIGVLMGGYSSEREISLKSGHAITEALRRQGCDVIALDIVEQDRENILSYIRQRSLDLAFIALHGRLGEDGTIQSVLEELNVVYTGSGVVSSRIAIDKVLTQDLFQKSGIMVPDHISLSMKDTARHARVIREIDFFPVVVKPARQGSSIGISLVRAPEGLAGAVREAGEYDDKILVEQYIQGKELTVGVLDREALPVIEIRPQGEFFDFTSKYSLGRSDYIIPAPLLPAIAAMVSQMALRAHQVLGCMDFSRVDFILADDGVPYVLEVNTIPGFTSTSLLPKAAQAIGIDFDHLCLRLAGLAYDKKKKIKYVF